MKTFDAGRVAPEAVDGRGVDLAVQARRFVDERVVPVVRPIIRLARRAVELDRVVSLEARPLRPVVAIAEGQQLASPVRKSTSESSARVDGVEKLPRENLTRALRRAPRREACRYSSSHKRGGAKTTNSEALTDHQT